MNINRDNYESFFLLYVDNELSAQEKTDVEQFLHNNPDLKKEFSLLLDSTLPTEAISFPAKASILKTISTEPIHEDMLLHLDNEGLPAFRVSMEKMIAGDQQLADEWRILQQTKLDPSDKVIFEEKHLLYRKERETVFFMRYWKIAVAALFIGAGGYFSVSFFNNKGTTENPPAAVAKVVKQPASGKTAPAEQLNTSVSASNNTIASNSILPAKKDTDNSTTQTSNQKKISTPNSVEENKIKDSNTPAVNDNEIANKPVPKKETNNLPTPYFENINNKESNQLATSTVEYNKKAFNNRNTSNDLAVVAPAVRPSNVTPAPGDGPLTELNTNSPKTVAYNETDGNNDNRVLYMNEEKVNKSKLGGFFRKVKRVIVRNAKIKTGDGLRIGGFEIASK